jgi:hypothetical protein
MLLPFMKNKEVSVAPASEPSKPKPDDDFDFLEVAAHEILDAVAKKDAKALAIAIRSAFEMCDSEPHHEGKHE